MSVDLIWGVDDRREWERLFTSIPRSNLLQSWAYGEAKMRVEGLAVRRAYVGREGRVVGLVQTLERHLGPLHLVRLNRGPLWLEAVSQEVAREVMLELRGGARWWRGRALFAAPEVLADNTSMLLELGYRRRQSAAWSSAWMDLSRTPDELRQGLDGKWRNLLRAGERIGQIVEADSGDEAFEWLVARHTELMSERKYVGTPAAILRELRRLRQEPGDLTVYRVQDNSEWTAGALVARHGTSATYLVGWSGQEGRRRHAANVLLFAVLLDLAQRHCRWLDLGGIDAVLTPGIARFKRGLGGQQYSLAGEFFTL
jgi:hypothetical protein